MNLSRTTPSVQPAVSKAHLHMRWLRCLSPNGIALSPNGIVARLGRCLAASLAMAMAMALPSPAIAADATAQVPMRDPWVPPAARRAASAPTTQGAALGAQVEKKLRTSFDAADADHDGTLTRDEARAARFGMVADHFDRIDTAKRGRADSASDRIDTAKRGRVGFEDLKRYLRGRGAATL
jgi:hypothetical protein